jgi:hypothetical protein
MWPLGCAASVAAADVRLAAGCSRLCDDGGGGVVLKPWPWLGSIVGDPQLHERPWRLGPDMLAALEQPPVASHSVTHHRSPPSHHTQS